MKKQRVLSQYDFNKKSKLALLNEQAQIARSLDIGKGSLSLPTQSYVKSSTTVFTTVDEDNQRKTNQNEPYVASAANNEALLYLRGYVAIEKEIMMLQSRKSPEAFIPQLAIIEDLKLQLLQDPTVSRANELFANTPIGSEEFSAAVYDLASLEYKSKTKATLVLALAIVLGGMLGIFVLLIRNALVNKD